jgi:hydrogenase nickel incorporation protein HypA/HybF
MHEMAICRSIVDIVCEQAQAADCRRVTVVRLTIGTLSHVEPDAVEFCFDAVSRGTLAEGARVEVERPPGRAWCLSCEETVELAARHAPCPTCGSHQLVLVSGEELRVKELEVE